MKIEAYRVGPSDVTLVPAEKERDWFVPHAYRCLPLSIANEMGWDMVLNKTTTFDWNGGDKVADLTVSEGDGYSHFGMGTFTFRQGLIWRTPEDVALMVMPVPNQIDDGFLCMSAIMETDKLDYPWFLSIRATRTGPVTIPAGTKLGRVMPTILGKCKLRLEREPREVHENRIRNSRERDGKPDDWLRFYHKDVKWSHVKSKVMEMHASSSRFEKVLTPEQCDRLIAMKDELECYNDEHKFWNDRVRHPEELPVDIKVKLDALSDLKHEKWQLVAWPDGYEMPLHEDYAGGNYPDRDIAAILYLNDDFEGGRTFFKDGKHIKPRKGWLARFDGGHIPHGVSKVTGGTRWTLITWYTKDKT